MTEISDEEFEKMMGTFRENVRQKEERRAIASERLFLLVACVASHVLGMTTLYGLQCWFAR